MRLSHFELMNFALKKNERTDKILNINKKESLPIFEEVIMN